MKVDKTIMFKTLVKIELAKQDLNQVVLSKRLSIAQPTLAKQMAKDDFRESRMREIAEALGCDLVIELKPKKEIATTKVDCES